MKVAGFSYYPTTQADGGLWRWTIQGNVVTRGPRSSLWEFATPADALADLKLYIDDVTALYLRK